MDTPPLTPRSDAANVSTGSLKEPALYLNRELSQIQLIQRVLELAQRPSLPVLERLRFLCITATIVDEFFEVRVASVKQQLAYGVNAPGPDGLSNTETLAEIRRQLDTLIADQYRTFNGDLTRALEEEGIHFIMQESWTASQSRWLRDYFRRELVPVLSPLGLDPAHPFPRILNKSLNFAIKVSGKDAFGREAEMALVRAPRSLPRVVRLPASYARGTHSYVLLSSIIIAFVDELFPGMEVEGCYQFRVTRNSELLVDEEEIKNLARALRGPLQERGFAAAVRLEVGRMTPAPIVEDLTTQFGLEESDVYRCDGPVNLNRVLTVYELTDRPELKYPSFKPRIQWSLSSAGSLFDVIRHHDVLLHHPYDSFASLVELVREASQDPDVLAIKQTLYRTGHESPMVDALVDAARSGKDVTVVIELRARFDEQANIDRANRLQEAGVQVVYGVVGYKTHAKMLLIVRREQGRMKRYAHLGTGNYHQGTARAYTDLGLLTCHGELTRDAHNLFQQLSGLGPEIQLEHLIPAPFKLHGAMIDAIDRETANAEAGLPARIMARMNGLTEPKIIRALYRASRAGVSIQLIVRGICCLRPGIEGVSENIEVRSVLGRFLEHSRVFYFENGGDPRVLISSADWMDRNMFYRVEAAFPLLNASLRKRAVKQALTTYFRDNTQSWLLSSDGTYRPVDRGRKKPFTAQSALIKKLCK